MTATVQHLLANAQTRLQGISDAPPLEAKLFLSHVLNKSTTWLLTWPEHTPLPDEIIQFDALIEQRQAGIPFAYLLGYADFYGRRFGVNTHTLIPRQDTELLIDLALEKYATKPPQRILDLGTGLGILAITLALEFPQAQVIAVDISQGALAQAARNAQGLGAHNLTFLESNWFNALGGQAPFELIVSNPPYIPENDPHLDALTHEPLSALVAPAQGMADIEQIAAHAKPFMHTGAWLMIEHGYDQHTQVMDCLTSHGYQAVQDHVDFGGNPRIITGQAL